MFLLNSLIFSESNSVGCEEGQKACRVGLGESCWREICFQGKHQSIIATPLEKYSYTIHISSFAIIHILPEGEVWLCGGGPEEVQGVHHQQSSWVKQGGRLGLGRMVGRIRINSIQFCWNLSELGEK